MADSKDMDKDKLADALARLANGLHPPDETDTRSASGLGHLSSPEEWPKSDRPLTPGGKDVPKPRGVPQPPQPPRSRPAMPQLSSADPAQPGAAAEGPLLEDDDAVIVPAPSPDVFLRKHPVSAPQRHAPLMGSLALRRTLIPILLTAGLILPTLATLWFTTEEESPFRRPGVGLPITFVIVGVLLLGTAVVNMLQVKHQMAAQR